MDNIDTKIKDILSRELTEPMDYEQKIRSSLCIENSNKSLGFIFKVIFKAIMALLFTTGVAFAGHTLYEKIWKEPKETNILEEKPISEEEKTKIVSEDEVKQKAIQLFEIFGYQKEDIKIENLVRNRSDDSNTIYNLSTVDDSSKKYFTFCGETGEFSYFLNDNFSKIENSLQKISKDSAISYAKEIFNKINVNLDSYEVENYNEFDNHEWSINLSKNYNGIYNNYDTFYISFGILSNKVIVHSISTPTFKDKSENNDTIITKEEAINIATQKEKEFSSLEISNISAEKGIKQMNSFIYCLENNIEDISSMKSDDRIRNVWIVSIKHPYTNEDLFNNFNFHGVKCYFNKRYFIDVSTGEIIGGERIEFDED